MSIPHIEDLSPPEFLHVMRNLNSMVVTEKLDGSNLLFGFDGDGEFYTSRESKGGKRFYHSNEYTGYSADNPFKAAHHILQILSPSFRKILDNGDIVETEILFGRQPNTIVYGSNYVAFLRMVSGSNDKLEAIGNTLKGRKIGGKVSLVTNRNGVLQKEKQNVVWKFTNVPTVPQSVIESINIDKELDEFAEWADTSSGSFKTKKALAEASKERILPIKEILLDRIVRTFSPSLRDCDVSPSEDFGIEGVVILDPNTGKQTKLVDKTSFMLINQFFYATRNYIRNTSWFKIENYEGTYKTFNANLQEIPNAYNFTLMRLSEILGIPDLGDYRRISRAIKKFQTVDDFIEAWIVPNDLKRLKSSISTTLNDGLIMMEEAKEVFDRTWKDNILVLNNGKEIRYTDEVYKRTISMIDEVRYGMVHALVDVHNSQNFTDIAYALYRKHLETLY